MFVLVHKKKKLSIPNPKLCSIKVPDPAEAECFGCRLCSLSLCFLPAKQPQRLLTWKPRVHCRKLPIPASVQRHPLSLYFAVVIGWNRSNKFINLVSHKSSCAGLILQFKWTYSLSTYYVLGFSVGEMFLSCFH